jgi:N-glycosylase/DNA lyase
MTVRTGYLSVGEPETALRLRDVLESGMTFCWRRDHGFGEMFDDSSAVPRYYTILPASESPTGEAEPIRVWRDSDTHLGWEARFDATPVVTDRLRLRDDLTAIRDSMPSDVVLDDAFDEWWGLRVPNDPAFPTLISFICSSQMRVERIHAMHVTLAQRYGAETTLDGEAYHAFPTPEQLATATEDDLRELKLGYRARYVAETAQMVADGDDGLREAAAMSYEDARDALTQYVGVGDKVSDCVLLYGLGFTEAVPIDTWIQSALDDHYPSLVKGGYATTSRAVRNHFGPNAGYAQAYLFHHLRSTA